MFYGETSNEFGFLTSIIILKQKTSCVGAAELSTWDATSTIAAIVKRQQKSNFTLRKDTALAWAWIALSKFIYHGSGARKRFIAFSRKRKMKD